MSTDKHGTWTRRAFFLAVNGLAVFAGIVISNFLEGWLKIRLEVTQAALLAATIIFSLAFAGLATAALMQVVQRSERTASDISLISHRLQTDSRFAFVEDMEDDVSDYKGRVFARLKDEVAKAETSVRAVALASVGDGNYLPASSYHSAEREAYFREIEGLVESKSASGSAFEYKRIFQLTVAPFRVPTTYKRHVEKVTSLRRPSIVVDIKRIDTNRMTGFLIIDARTLILMLGGVLVRSDSGKSVTVSYPTSLLIFCGGIFEEVVQTYTRYFDYLASKGSSV